MTRNKAFSAALAALLIAVALGYGIDWRFWYRWYTIPEDAGEWPASYYQPTTRLPGNPGAGLPAATPAGSAVDPAALKAAADYAEARNSIALLVWHKGALQLERYWQGATQDELLTGRAMTRSLLPPLVALAIAEGDLAGLDEPVATYLEEWRGDARGAITLRQLLLNTSGLENRLAGPQSGPRSKEVRLSLGSDFAAVALRYRLVAEPGTVFSHSNANAQLLAIVLERATGVPYEDYLQTRLWGPLEAAPAELYMDRFAGMPAAYCCFRARARDWLRFGIALLNDGQVNGRQVWPAGWVGEMRVGSAANPNYGYQVWTGNPPTELREYFVGTGRGVQHGGAIADPEVMFLEGGGYRTLYVLPQSGLVVLRLGYTDPGWETSALPNLLISGTLAAPDLGPTATFSRQNGQ